MSAAEIVAIVTTVGTVVTGLAATAALRADRQAEVHNRMPTLIAPSRDKTTITIRNVGNGPAFNIKIARAGRELGERDALDVSRRALRATRWTNTRHLQPLHPGVTAVCSWTTGPAVALSYTDALGKPYTTLATQYGTKIFDGDAIEEKLNTLEYAEMTIQTTPN